MSSDVSRSTPARVYVLVACGLLGCALLGVRLYLDLQPSRRAQRVSSARSATWSGSMPFWLGTWNATVKPFFTYAELPESERPMLAWSRDVAASVVGDWAIRPGERVPNTESPLKQMTPDENDALRRIGVIWRDRVGNAWAPSDGQKRSEFWIQCAVRHAGRDALLGMAFSRSKTQDGAFDFYFMLSLDSGNTWLVSTWVEYEANIGGPSGGDGSG